MRFLVDACLSPRLATSLSTHGHDAVHVVLYGMAAAADADVMGRAVQEGRTVVSADTDFGTILAATRASAPSVVLFRLDNDRRVEELVALIEANRETVETAIEAGSIVVITDALVRVRSLPIL